MTAHHDSRDPRLRSPFGAVPCGTVVRLACEVTREDGGDPTAAEVLLHYAYGCESFVHSTQRTIPHRDACGVLFDTSLRMPGEPCLFFYWFEVRPDRDHPEESGSFYLIGPQDHLGGKGRSFPHPPEISPDSHSDRHPFQVTVYDAAFHAPEWVKGAVMYQIFPDRFARGQDYSRERFLAARPDPARILHEDWDEDVDFEGTAGYGYTASDFYGGTLRGIEEKLDHLASMGVEVVYLNPVFESRSNHRYDTADYRRIDPVLGDAEDFRRLCDRASGMGIRILLDGVFSHTGDDSRYFNRYGRYEEIGAYQEAEGKGFSPYRSWYGIRKGEGGRLLYDSWWGFESLPAVHENDLSFRTFLFGEDGVLRHWLGQGASGFRLDVSDELPDGFLRDLRRCVRGYRADGFLLGEVWEDASRKISYGSYRDFLLGRSHDSVMGYPFRDSLLGWLNGQIDAAAMDRRLESIRENYPPESFHSQMTLLGSHDVLRAVNALSGVTDPGDRASQAATRLTDDERALARQRLMLAVVFQMTYPGSPSIYYGDEVGMEGFRDPFNRRTYPWNRPEERLLEHFRTLGRLRRETPVLRTGRYETLEASGDHVAFRRTLVDGADAFGRQADGPTEVVVSIDRGRGRATVEADGVVRFRMGD